MQIAYVRCGVDEPRLGENGCGWIYHPVEGDDPAELLRSHVDGCGFTLRSLLVPMWIPIASAFHGVGGTERIHGLEMGWFPVPAPAPNLRLFRDWTIPCRAG